jgi:predicted nucleic acid-binding protein
MFPIKTDTLLSKDAIWRVQALALEFTLCAYDAVYLELAERRGLGLATLDRPLHTAARNAGIKVIHL